MKTIEQTKVLAPKSEAKTYGDTLTLWAYSFPAALYRRETPGGYVTWEVWRFRWHNALGLQHPTSSQWGTYGWTFLTYTHARCKYMDLRRAISSTKGMPDECRTMPPVPTEPPVRLKYMQNPRTV